MKKTSTTTRSQKTKAIKIALAMCVTLLGMLATTAIRSQSCTSCQDENIVQIRFKTKMCAESNVNVTLNGATASTVGMTCTANELAASPWTFADMKLDQTYPITVGTDVCVTHIIFDVPDGYTLEINGEETNTINKRGPSKGDGDGTWNLVLKEKCEQCISECPGDYCMLRVGSIEWAAGLGLLSDGRSARAISIREDALTAQSYTPLALVYSPPGKTNEVDVVRNPDTSLRQVRAPQALANVVVISASEYEIRFYRPEDVGVKTGGVYPVSGSPFTTWRVRNPDTSNTTRLEISKIQTGLTEVNEFKVDPATNSWTLVRNGGLRVESMVNVPLTNGRMEIVTVRDGVTQQIASKKEIIFHTFAWGEEVVREIVYPYDNSVQQLALVEVAPLVTEYKYYETSDANCAKSSKLASLKRPDGSWEKYCYDDLGNVTLLVRPWKDQPFEGGTELNGHATYYKYTNNDGIVVSEFVDMIDHVDERINNIRVGRTTYDRTGITLNGEPAVREVMTVYSSASVGIQTVTTRYHRTASNLYANRVASIEHPDGRKDTFTYEYGDYTVNPDPSQNQFTPNPTGKAQRDTVTRGTVASPSGVAFKTTRDVSVTNEEGQSALSETYVYNGSNYDRANWSVTDYDDRSHAVQTRSSNGTMTTTAWNGDRMTSATDANGIQTAYTYDNLNRTKTATKVGIAAAGGYPSQPDVVTTYNYDAEDRIVSEVKTAGSLSLTKSSKFDLAGRTKELTNEAGLVTIYDYTNGGRTRKIVSPGGAFRLTDNYLDGQSKSTTGSAVIASFFDYSVNADGTQVTQQFVGDAAAGSPRWIKNTVNWAAQIIRTERPGFISGTNLITTTAYNNKGQRIVDSNFAGAAKVVVDTRYDYDELGRLVRQGMDVDANGILAAASTDRMTETESTFEQNGSDWFSTTATRRYLTDNNATATITAQKERLTFSVGSPIASELISVDENGNVTSSTTAIDRPAKKVTSITNVPDSVNDSVAISVNGLLQSATPTTPENATTYIYDGLGRTTSVISPRTGSTVTAYDPANGRMVAEANGTVTKSFDYYPASHLNAGRVRSETDAASKKVYFEYDARGAQIRMWGDTKYPVETLFDSYGQQTELRTFRGGKGWQLASFPVASAGTADTTRWIYHEPTGLLTASEDAEARQTVYTYDAAGRVTKKRWARTVSGNPLETVSSFDPETGEVTSKNYSDATTDVTYVSDRAGRVASITDAAGSHSLTYNAVGDLAGDATTGGILDGISVSIGYDGFLRRNGLQAMSGATSIIEQAYTYDANSRLSTISRDAQTATYGYFPASGLLNTTSYTGGTAVARTYDAQGRLETITNTPANGSPTSYSYVYNNVNQRTRVTREDGSYWSYVYNDRGEVVSGKKSWSDNVNVAGQQFEYGYDNIGNRHTTKSGGDPTGSNLRQSNFVANGLNQLAQRSVPGAIDVMGTSDAAATVTVNNFATYRRGSYFHSALSLDNSSGPVSSSVNVIGVKPNVGPNGEDAVEQKSGSVSLPPALEANSYDADGNLVADGLWQYTWDAENRLTSMTSAAQVPDAAKKRLEFAYDYQGRRIEKKVYVWNAGGSSYDIQATTRFVYDEWNLIAELDVTGLPLRTFTWGQDASGIRDGVGGIGGLLEVRDASDSYHVAFDGSGNVTGMMNAASGQTQATFEYDPYGNTLQESGPSASKSPFRFSTKYTDSETGLIYYGHRFYHSSTGRWLSRDPIAEEGGFNLYQFADNNPISYVDPLGLQRLIPDPTRLLRKVITAKKVKADSANWDLATGGMDHTVHAIRLSVCTFPSTMIRQIYKDLENFNHFTPNIATLQFGTLGPITAHFELNDPTSRYPSNYIARNSIDIALEKKPAKKEVYAVTLGGHPLVGVRRWLTKTARSSRGEPSIEIQTEAYDNVSSVINNVGRGISGREAMRDMWDRYLNNIAGWWNKKYGARTLDNWYTGNTEVKGENPFKKELPGHLQVTNYESRW